MIYTFLMLNYTTLNYIIWLYTTMPCWVMMMFVISLVLILVLLAAARRALAASAIHRLSANISHDGGGWSGWSRPPAGQGGQIWQRRFREFE